MGRLPSDVLARLAGRETPLPALAARPRRDGAPAGPVGGQGSGSGTAETDRPQVIAVPPADVQPIPGAQDIFKILKTFNLGAGLVYEPPELVLQVPQGSYATIQFISIFCNAPTVATDVDWALLINGAPVPGFSNLSFSPRVAASFERSFPASVRVSDGAKIGVRITNNGAGAEDIGSSYGGWYWDKNAGERYTGLPFLNV